MGLKNIKGIGSVIIKELSEEIESKPFSNYIDFVTRISLKKIPISSIELLIKSGAINILNINIPTALHNLANVLDYAKLITKKENQKIYYWLQD